MQEYLHHSRLGSKIDALGFHLFAFAFSFLWFILLWGLRFTSLAAGLALYGLIAALRKKVRDDHVARKEKELRCAIGGELALERLSLSLKERAHFETAMLLSLRHPLVLLESGEDGTLCDRRGEKILVSFVQLPPSSSVGAEQVLSFQRTIRTNGAERGLLCVPCGIQSAAREQAQNDPPVSFLSREQLIPLFGRVNPVTDEQLVALGKRKKFRQPLRIFHIVFNRSRARRYACYGCLLLLMYQFAPLFYYAAAGLACVFLAAFSRAARENRDSLFE